MEKEILKYLSKYTVITKALETAIEESALIRSFEKGTILLEEGKVSHECYFVVKGCVRGYLVKDGEEKTVELYTEEQVILPPGYGKSIPTSYSLECLEDVILSVGNPTLEKEAFEKYPELESLSRVIAEAVLANQQESFTEFKTSSPEQRYLNLMKNRPELIQRVSQYQLASYLGIKPESLSRIRKRILNREMAS